VPGRIRPTFGYERRSQVKSANPKVCRKCDMWFAPRPRESVCDGCVRPSERSRRAALAPDTRPGSSLGKTAGQRQGKNSLPGTFSDVLGLTFKPGAPLWRVLALEAAARIDARFPKEPVCIANAKPAVRPESCESA
jgi:hypothetical protein